MDDARLVAEGLRFPEGPVVLPDGSLLVCEMATGQVARIAPGGGIERIDVGGGPNGAALGPDGALYLCNNGGWPMQQLGPMLIPDDVNQGPDYEGGSIQRLDLGTGVATVLYEGLHSPNDLVFDEHGGFWFTDYGKQRERDEDRGVVYYALADGSSVRPVVRPLFRPNGVGLSADGRTLFVAETPTGRLWRWDVTAPGEVGPVFPYPHGGTLVVGVGGHQWFDSLGVEADGNVCVGTLFNPGITVVSPDGPTVEHVKVPPDFFDPLVTNICWGGDDMSTAYITLSATGRVMSCRWPRPGLRLRW